MITMILWNKTFCSFQKEPGIPLKIPEQRLVCNDSAPSDPDCILTTVAQPYLHLSKVFDQPLNGKALKNLRYSWFTTVFIFWTFLSGSSISRFFSKKHYRHNINTNSQPVSYVQINSSAKVQKKFSEVEHINDQLTEFQKNLILANKNNQLNHAELKNLNYLTLNFWRKVFMNITLHFSPVLICNWVWKPCNTLLMKYNLLSHYPNKFLLSTYLIIYDTNFLSLMKNSNISNIKSCF